MVLDGIDLTVAEHDTIGLIGPNGVGKTTLLRTLAGQIAPDRGAVERTPPTATVGYLPQERNRGHELVTDYLHRRTGATDASAELDAATAALRGRRARCRHAVRRRAHPLAVARRRRPAGAARRGVVRAEPPTRAARTADVVAVRRRSGTRRTGGAAAVALRRVPARRADQRPRPRRAGDARAMDRGAARRRRARQPRPHVSRPHRRQRVRDRRVHAHRHAVHGRLAGVPRRAGRCRTARVGAVRGVRRAEVVAGPARPARTGVGDPGPGEAQAVRRERQEHPCLPAEPDRAARRQGGADREGDRSTGRRRQAAGAVAAAPRHPDRSPER